MRVRGVRARIRRRPHFIEEKIMRKKISRFIASLQVTGRA